MEIQTIETAVLQPKPLRGSAKIIYELLCSKYRNKEILYLKELVFLWADTMIPEYRRHKAGGFNVHGRWEVKEVKSNEWVKKNWDTLSSRQGQAIQWLKYHIGNLVLNGYAVAVPIINFNVNEKLLKDQNAQVSDTTDGD